MSKSLVIGKILTNFAATVPTTPLPDAYHGGTSVFIYIMKYNKRPIDFPAQIALLKERGMIFNDEDKVLHHKSGKSGENTHLNFEKAAIYHLFCLKKRQK